MNTLILLLLLSLTIIPPLVSLSKPIHHNHDGFTADLIHKDSPLYPLHNPTDSLTDRLQNAAFRLPKRAGGFASKTKVPSYLIGDYLMKFQIGTPPVQVFVGVTLGPNIAWTQCHKQAGAPFFTPASSSTYRVLSCQSNVCKAVVKDDHIITSCDKRNSDCRYVLYEVNGTETVIGTDTFWFGQTPIRNVLFACLDDDYKVPKHSDSENYISGVIGLGDDLWSLISQLKPVINGRFSYCLTSNESKNRTSKLYFGARATVSWGPNVVSTSYVKDKSFKTYNIFLLDVVVGNSSSYTTSTYTNDQSSSNDDDREIVNMRMDFSTVPTLIPRGMYDRFSSSLVKAIGGEIAHIDHLQWADSVCYKDLNLDRVPVVTFRFSGGDVKVPPKNIFLEVGKGLSCCTIQSTQLDYNHGWLGNLLQRNFMVGFDLVKQKVYFKPTNCTMQN